MMHPIDEVLSAIGFAIAAFGFCAALLCSQSWIVWTTLIGVALMVFGQGLDKWREWKREQTKKNWW